MHPETITYEADNLQRDRASAARHGETFSNDPPAPVPDEWFRVVKRL